MITGLVAITPAAGKSLTSPASTPLLTMNRRCCRLGCHHHWCLQRLYPLVYDEYPWSTSLLFPSRGRCSGNLPYTFSRRRCRRFLSWHFCHCGGLCCFCSYLTWWGYYGQWKADRLAARWCSVYHWVERRKFSLHSTHPPVPHSIYPLSYVLCPIPLLRHTPKPMILTYQQGHNLPHNALHKIRLPSPAPHVR